MHSKPRKPKSLLIYEALDGLKAFTSDQNLTYQRLKRGYHGEMAFYDAMSERFLTKHQPIFDLSLKINGSETQFDALIPTKSTLYHLEIKNYSNEFFIENDHWHLDKGNLIQNPLIQLNRANELLKILLNHHQLNLPIESYLVFVNATFHLHQAPKTWPIIYPNRIQNLLQKIGQKHRAHPTLSSLFINHHIPNSIFEKIPTYKKEELRKGFFCRNCRGQMHRKNKSQLVCPACGELCRVVDALTDAIKTYAILFPHQKISTHAIQEWVGGAVHRTYIQKQLRKHYRFVYHGPASHYVSR